jgi:hypothetical protein
VTAEDPAGRRHPPLERILLEWTEKGKTRRVVLDCSIAEKGNGEIRFHWLDRAGRCLSPPDGGDKGQGGRGGRA